MVTALLVIAILVVLIVVHELGHFVAAKLSGVRVEEFGVGYPPRAFLLGTWGRTEYTVNWVPFGGFVRLWGDFGTNTHGKGALVDAARWKQAIILVAGVTMNALMAWVLFAIAFHSGVLEPVATPAPGQHAHVIVSQVFPNTPAYAAGLSAGDEIIDVSDSSGAHAQTPLTADSLANFISARPGELLHISYSHGRDLMHATLTPAQGVLTSEAGKPAIGIALVLAAVQSESWSQAIPHAGRATLDTFGNVLGSLQILFDRAASGKPSLAGVVGPVGIVGYVHSAAQNGIGAVLELAAIISVNLAIFNLIPIPALDGGRLFILGIEGVMRKPAPKLAQQVLNILGIAFIIFLMVIVTYHDISHLLG